jgi:hypothetical protein
MVKPKKSGIIKQYSGNVKYLLLMPIGFINKHPFKNLYYDTEYDQLYRGTEEAIR